MRATASYSNSMERIVLEPARIHPAAQAKLANNHRAIVEECQRAVVNHDVVVIGMSQNPHPRRARKALRERHVPFHYLEYGSYLGAWRERTALKMWTGWPTFPMVFVRGTLIGGADELQALLVRGELDALAKA
jgi:monothiol glutaredoxin